MAEAPNHKPVPVLCNAFKRNTSIGIYRDEIAGLFEKTALTSESALQGKARDHHRPTVEAH